MNHKVDPTELELERAIEFAKRAHEGQVDKAGNPYFDHVERVMKAVADHGLIVTTAAVLHDTVEDTEVTIGRIQAEFGSAVARIVDSLTRREGEVYLKEYIPRVYKDPAARVIKLADIADNMSRMEQLEPANREFLISRYTQANTILCWKMYVLVLNTVPLGLAMTAACHAVLACYLKFEDDPIVQQWAHTYPFKKVICKLTAAEFAAAKKHADYVLMTERALGGTETAMAFAPRPEWPKPFKFYRLYN